MPVHLPVALALFRAYPARRGARFELHQQQLRVGLALPRQHLGCGVADIGAVQVQHDALLELLDLFFPDAGVGAHGATVGALGARRDAGGKLFQIEKGLSRMSLQHLLCFHAFLLLRLDFPRLRPDAGVE